MDKSETLLERAIWAHIQGENKKETMQSAIIIVGKLSALVQFDKGSWRTSLVRVKQYTEKNAALLPDSAKERSEKEKNRLMLQFEKQGLLIRCPKCKRENYALAVATGTCAFCGYHATPVKKTCFFHGPFDEETCPDCKIKTFPVKGNAPGGASDIDEVPAGKQGTIRERLERFDNLNKKYKTCTSPKGVYCKKHGVKHK